VTTDQLLVLSSFVRQIYIYLTLSHVVFTVIGVFTACICCRRASVCHASIVLRIMQTMPYDSPGTLVFWCQRSRRNSNGVTPNGGAK